MNMRRKCRKNSSRSGSTQPTNPAMVLLGWLGLGLGIRMVRVSYQN